MEASRSDPSGGPGGAGEGGAPGARASRRARLVLDLAGAVLFSAGLGILLFTFLRWPIQSFDEGVLLTGAMLVRQGQALYRDFYSNYPPGIFWLISALWDLFGVSPMVLRYLGLGIHLGLALVAGRLAGRAGGRRFSWLGAGLCLAWLSLLGNIPFAWLAGLLAALLFIERLGVCSVAGSPVPWVLAGLALGVLGVLRHDLFVYLGLSLVMAAAAWAANTRRLRPPEGILRKGAPGAVVAIAVLCLVWVPTLVRAGVSVAAGDLYFDQVRYTMPSRVLPMPDLFRLLSMPSGVVLPAFVSQSFEGAAFLTLAGPFLGAAALLVVRRRERRFDRTLLLGTALSLAVIPQLLGRTDVYHALFSVTPALVLGSVLAERASVSAPRRLRLAAGALLVTLLAMPVSLHLPGLLGVRPPTASADQPERYGGLPEWSEEQWAARREVLAFLARSGRAGDPIFVGCVDHRFPFMSEMDLYFLSDRTGATRYMQFDPGLVGRAEEQAQMVRDLERSRPAVAVLSRHCAATEPNASAIPGATVLDDYLKARYRAVGTSGPYLLLERR